MGFRFIAEGPNDTIELGMENLTDVNYRSETPNDSNARATDVGSMLDVEGKILASTEGEEADETKKLAEWSLVSAEKVDAYRDVTIEVISADQVVRKLKFPQAFVVDYTEDYGADEGVGSFDLVLKQKRDKNDLIEIEGGYEAE